MNGSVATKGLANLLGRLARIGSCHETAPRRDFLAILPADQLLAHGARPGLLRRIDSLLGVPNPHLDALYRPSILNYARFVQQLPASEAHHHAGPGGMLDHGLEVAAGALALRLGHLLPPGAEPEHLAKNDSRWTYAVFTAALLHDIGKPAVDQRVTLHKKSGRPIGTWDPWQGPMDKHAAWYRVEFVRNRVHGLHERVGPLLARSIIPARGLSWLAGDLEVLAAWTAAISGDWERAGALGEIVARADGQSVARNLGAGDGARLPTARVTPLHEKLLTALRYLLDEGELPLNRNGAAGWLADDSLWLVSKRVADALRAHLLREGHDGIPTRNDRIFDVLQEHGLCVPDGERAIWRAQVAAEAWAHELTLLRLPASRIWPDPERRPDLFAGSVTPLQKPSDEPEADGDSVVPHDAPAPSEAPTGAQRTTPAEPAPHTPDTSDPGHQFLAWLTEGLRSQRLPINTVNARVHIVPEGVLLVSPGIFKDFAAQHPEHDWNLVQKRFQKLKLHRKTDTGTNVHRYRVAGERRRSAINGLLVEDPSALFGKSDVPAANPHLSAGS